MTLTFSPLTADAIDHVLPMMAQLYAEGGYDEGGYDEDRQRRALVGLLAAPEHGAAWLIHADGHSDGHTAGQTVGYLVVTVGYSLEFHGRYALLDELCVDAGWRGRGIGAQALTFAEEWGRIRGFSALRLEVGLHNPGALRLYVRSGFSTPDRHLLTKAL